MTGTCNFDVLVIGGGPSGTAAALTLLEYSSLTVAVLEKTNYTNKRIGETVSPSLLPLLRYLGLESDFLRGKHLKSYGIDAAWGTSRLLSRDFLFTFHGNGWHLDRTKFDHMMASRVLKKGGTLFTNMDILTQKQNKKWKIVAVDRNDRKHVLTADFVIDASGKNAVFARKLGANWKVLDNLVGIVGFYRQGRQKKSQQRMTMESVPDGWWYSSPLPRNRQVVVFMTDSDIAKKIGIIDNWNVLVKKTTHIKKAIRGKLISTPQIYPAYSHIIQKIPKRNWLPAGDVASSFDPVSSMGIGYAILSGIHAARKAYEQLTGDTISISNYMGNINENFQQYLSRRSYYYQTETRWKDEPFWQRRLTKISNSQ